MISKLIKQRELKRQLAEIRKNFKIATKFKTRAKILTALNNVFLELRDFEEKNINTAGYTPKINNAVFNLYYKIDTTKIEYMEYYDKLYYKQ